MSDDQPIDDIESVTVNGDELNPGQLVNLFTNANPQEFSPDENDEVTVVVNFSEETTVDEVTIDSSTPPTSVIVEYEDGTSSPAEVSRH